MATKACGEWENIGANLVKIGNSYCVRIPIYIVKRLGVEEDDLLMMQVKKMELEFSPQVKSFWHKMARSCSQLDEFSDEKINFFSELAFNEGKQLMDVLGGKFGESFDKGKKLAVAKKSKKVFEDGREKIRQQFGEKVHQDYLLFRRIIDPKIMKERDKQRQS
jgi:antitoxin component of MazEF toxin-antitoxin module